MPYSKYGAMFKKAREQKKYSLSDFSSIGISKASLSRFERGKTTMSFERVNDALQLMEICLEEYENFLNDYSPNLSEEMLTTIYDANMLGKHYEVKELFEIAKINEFFYVGLAAKSCYEKLSDEEIDDLAEYFYSIDVWGYSDLCILYLIIHHLRKKDSFHLVRSLMDEKHVIFNSRKHNEIAMEIFCKSIFMFSRRGYQKNAEYIVKRLENNKFVNTMFLNNLYNFCYGYYIFCFKDNKKGLKKIERALENFNLIGTAELATFFQRQYDKYIFPDINNDE